MPDIKDNFMNVIKDMVYEDIENSTFEGRQKYYELFPETGRCEFPIFFSLSQTGIQLELPRKFAFGLDHFMEYMKKKGWRFDKQNVTDFELSETYRVVQPPSVESGHRQWDLDMSKYQSEINLPCLLEKMYYESGFITEGGEPVSLYQSCKYADYCWAALDERKPDNENVNWSYLSFPWIGENYYKHKILVLGINTNEGGGFEFNTQIITEARKELEKGRKRVNFGYVFPSGKKYVGTYLWHRIACYTKAVREALCCDGDDIYDDRLRNMDNIQEEYDHNSFLNHIKCSPEGGRSKPSAAMWKNCGAHVLKQELEILSPAYLVVLGVGDNIYYLINDVLAGDIHEVNSRSDVKLYYTRHFGKPIKIIVVPHPSSNIKESLISQVFESTVQAKRMLLS